MKAVFFDRDGTLNEEVNYLTSISQINVFPEVVPSLSELKKNGFLNIIISNQSAIARGLLSVSELENINNHFKEIISENGNSLIDDIFYSPFHKDGIVEKYKIESSERKPGPGLIEKAVEKYSLDLAKCFFVGDSFVDMKCAENAGIKKILLLTGYGREHFESIKKENINIECIANNLYEAVRFILEN